MKYRFATAEDCDLLGELNHQLIQDEGHRNRMTAAELAGRMREWLADEYRGVIFEDGERVIGYALYREEEEQIYLRQLFIEREQRGKGYGRAAMEWLRGLWPKEKRLTVEVLVANERAVRFWRAMGYRDYSLTLEIMPDERLS